MNQLMFNIFMVAYAGFGYFQHLSPRALTAAYKHNANLFKLFYEYGAFRDEHGKIDKDNLNPLELQILDNCEDDRKI